MSNPRRSKRVMMSVLVREEFGDYLYKMGWLDIDEGMKRINDFHQKLK